VRVASCERPKAHLDPRLDICIFSLSVSQGLTLSLTRPQASKQIEALKLTRFEDTKLADIFSIRIASSAPPPVQASTSTITPQARAPDDTDHTHLTSSPRANAHKTPRKKPRFADSAPSPATETLSLSERDAASDHESDLDIMEDRGQLEASLNSQSSRPTHMDRDRRPGSQQDSKRKTRKPATDVSRRKQARARLEMPRTSLAADEESIAGSTLNAHESTAVAGDLDDAYAALDEAEDIWTSTTPASQPAAGVLLACVVCMSDPKSHKLDFPLVLVLFTSRSPCIHIAVPAGAAHALDVAQPASISQDPAFLAEMQRPLVYHELPPGPTTLTPINIAAPSHAPFFSVGGSRPPQPGGQVHMDATTQTMRQTIASMTKEDVALVSEVLSYRGPTSVALDWLPGALGAAFEATHAAPDTDQPHASGCARGEVFRTLSQTERMRHVAIKRGSVNSSAVEPLPRVGVEKKEESRATRAEQRRFRVAAEDLQNVDLVKYNQLKGRRKKLRFEPSMIHGWGLFTMEDIPAGEMVVEYVGELVRSIIADRREVGYTERGIGSSYLFRLADVGIVDATKCGGVGRFMNHSCNVSGALSHHVSIMCAYIDSLMCACPSTKPCALQVDLKAHRRRAAQLHRQDCVAAGCAENRCVLQGGYSARRRDHIRLQVPRRG
jgi:hypothetical protein